MTERLGKREREREREKSRCRMRSAFRKIAVGNPRNSSLKDEPVAESTISSIKSKNTNAPVEWNEPEFQKKKRRPLERRLGKKKSIEYGTFGETTLCIWKEQFE